MLASNHPHVLHQLLGNTGDENSLGPIKNNEVLKNGTSQGINKTPAKSIKQRRALGDISNRKRGILNDSSVKKGTGLQLHHQQSNPLSTLKTPGFSKNKEVAFLPRPTHTKHASSVNILPDLGIINKSPKAHHQLPKSHVKKGRVTIQESLVEEREKSAGRLWIDEPDDISCDSISLPGAETLRKDWMANCRQSRARRLNLREEQEQREELVWDNHVEEVFANDGKSGTCIGSVNAVCLSLIVDLFGSCPEVSLGANLWIERLQTSELGIDSDLSFEAPSYCCDISF
jgi:hypothetical protein